MGCEIWLVLAVQGQKLVESPLSSSRPDCSRLPHTEPPSTKVTSINSFCNTRSKAVPGLGPAEEGQEEQQHPGAGGDQDVPGYAQEGDSKVTDWGDAETWVLSVLTCLGQYNLKLSFIFSKEEASKSIQSLSLTL